MEDGETARAAQMQVAVSLQQGLARPSEPPRFVDLSQEDAMTVQDDERSLALSTLDVEETWRRQRNAALALRESEPRSRGRREPPGASRREELSPEQHERNRLYLEQLAANERANRDFNVLVADLPPARADAARRVFIEMVTAAYDRLDFERAYEAQALLSQMLRLQVTYVTDLDRRVQQIAEMEKK